MGIEQVEDGEQIEISLVVPTTRAERRRLLSRLRKCSPEAQNAWARLMNAALDQEAEAQPAE